MFGIERRCLPRVGFEDGSSAWLTALTISPFVGKSSINRQDECVKNMLKACLYKFRENKGQNLAFDC
jgi:hypothetical protein